MTEKFYARPEGWHYHKTLNCPMLRGGDFQSLEYTEITDVDIDARELRPCPCVVNFGCEGEESA